jgi:hypothetical protein
VDEKNTIPDNVIINNNLSGKIGAQKRAQTSRKALILQVLIRIFLYDCVVVV